MSRKKEISDDIWTIFREVYEIHPEKSKSDKQEQLIEKIVDYIDTNLSTRRKRQDNKESK